VASIFAFDSLQGANEETRYELAILRTSLQDSAVCDSEGKYFLPDGRQADPQLAYMD
jgi:hypothetical protein